MSHVVACLGGLIKQGTLYTTYSITMYLYYGDNFTTVFFKYNYFVCEKIVYYQ